MFLNNKKLIKLFLYFFIFILIIFVLGLPFTKWSFYKDDYGNLFRSQAKNLYDIFDFFINGDTETICLGNIQVKQSFLYAYYRPFLFLYTYVQEYFLGLNGYFYHIFMVAIHAINSVLIFNIFLEYFSIFNALWGALFFAFNISLFSWLGWLGGLQYHVQLLFFLILIIFLKKYLETKKFKYYFISCFCLLLSVFSGEPPIVTPVWVFLVLFFYNKSFLKNLLISSGFFVISIFYLLVKLYLYPFVWDTSKYLYKPELNSYFSRIIERKGDFISFIVDFSGLSFIPAGYSFLKFFLILIFFLIFTYLFIKTSNKNKKIILFLVLSIILFSWPVLFIKYRPRYIYISLIFFILILLILLNYLNKNLFLKILLSFILVFNSYYLYYSLREREYWLNVTDSAYKQLAQLVLNIDLNNKKIYFFDLPKDLFREGFNQAIWLYTKNKEINFLVIDKKNLNNFKDKNSIFITWDYLNKRFKILNE